MSAIKKEYCPNGNIASLTNMVNGTTNTGEVFDFAVGIVLDGAAGHAAGRITSAKPKSLAALSKIKTTPKIM